MISFKKETNGSILITKDGNTFYIGDTSDIVISTFGDGSILIENVAQFAIDELELINDVAFSGTVFDAMYSLANDVFAKGQPSPPPIPTTPFVPEVSNLWASYDMSIEQAVTQDIENVIVVPDNSGNGRDLTKAYTLFPQFTPPDESRNFGYISSTSTDKRGIYQDGFSLSGAVTFYAVIKQNGFLEYGGLINYGPVWDAVRQETKDGFEIIRPARYSNGNYFSRNARNDNWQILTFCSNADQSFFRINNQYAVPMVSGQIGDVIGLIAIGETGYETDFDIAQLHIIEGVVSPEDDSYMINYLMNRFNPPFVDFIDFMGDSITEGSGPYTFDTIWDIYPELVSQAVSKNIYNHGISGSRVFNYPNSSSGIDLVDVYPTLFTKPMTGWLTIAYGVNDATNLTGDPTGDAAYIALWKAQLKTILQEIISHGQNPDKIILCTTGYEPTRPLCELFRAPYSELATELGTRYYDAWQYTLDNYGTGYCADNTHPMQDQVVVYAAGLTAVFNA